MGNWKRRWLPRKKYIRETPEFSHGQCHAEPESSGIGENSVPSWEKQFCYLVGAVPWQKVVVVKRYMSCHDNVVKWNDSAGEEAFNNAKERFWAAINCIPCDIPQPDPDMYIDEIDWNPDINPELILDLEQEFFNPDVKGKDENVDAVKQKSLNSVFSCAVEWHDNQNNDDHQLGSSDLKDVARPLRHTDVSNNDSWNLDSSDNPWEQSYTKINIVSKDNAWGSCGEKSWGWNPGGTSKEQSKDFGSPWKLGNRNAVPTKEKGWGDARNNWGQSCWESNARKSRKFDSSDTPWVHSLNQGNDGGKYRGWGDYIDKTMGFKQWGNPNTQKSYNFNQNGEDRENLNGGCWKKEHSYQHSSRYKSSRFEDGDFGARHHRSNGKAHKRASFA